MSHRRRSHIPTSLPADNGVVYKVKSGASRLFGAARSRRPASGGAGGRSRQPLTRLGASVRLSGDRRSACHRAGVPWTTVNWRLLISPVVVGAVFPLAFSAFWLLVAL